MTKSIQTALNIFLESEELTESDSCFCNFCASYQPTSMDHQITKVGIYLILELKRFVNHNADFIKDFTKVSSHENFLYHLLLMRLVSTSLALKPQPTIQEPLIEDNILLLLNSSILHLGFSLMMLPLLDHLWRKQIILLYIFTSMKPFKKITLPCFVRELTSFFVFRSDNPYLQASNTQSFKLSYCKLVLDVFSKKPTAKIKMLESTQDKTHSISSHQVLDKQYLDQVEKKAMT